MTKVSAKKPIELPNGLEIENFYNAGKAENKYLGIMIVHGKRMDSYPVTGKTAEEVRAKAVEIFSAPPEAEHIPDRKEVFHSFFLDLKSDEVPLFVEQIIVCTELIEPIKTEIRKQQDGRRVQTVWMHPKGKPELRAKVLPHEESEYKEKGWVRGKDKEMEVSDSRPANEIISVYKILEDNSIDREEIPRFQLPGYKVDGYIEGTPPRGRRRKNGN